MRGGAGASVAPSSCSGRPTLSWQRTSNSNSRKSSSSSQGDDTVVARVSIDVNLGDEEPVDSSSLLASEACEPLFRQLLGHGRPRQFRFFFFFNFISLSRSFFFQKIII